MSLTARVVRRAKLLLVAISAAAVLAGTPLPASASHSLTEQVSAGAINGSGDFPAIFRAASADGSRVFFESFEKLAATDTDDARDVYERSGGVTVQVSLGTINGNGAIDAFFVGSTPDGSKVWFYTDEALLAGDGDSAKDVYERSGGTTKRISVGAVNDDSSEAAFFEGASADGSRVFFLSEAQLVAADTDDAEDIYQRSGNTTTLISRGAINGNSSISVSFEGLSSDGSVVVFTTDEQLVVGDTDAQTDIYQRAGGITTLVSRGSINGNGPFDATYAGLSANGARIYFSTDEQLVPGDTDSATDIYRRAAGMTRRISKGNSMFDNAFFEGLSANGRVVYYITREQLRTTDQDASLDVYSRKRSRTKHVSQGAINGNAEMDVYFSGASANGARVFFRSPEQLAVGDSDSVNDVYQRYAGVTTMLTFGAIAGNGPFGAFLVGASADGTRVFFVTDEALNLFDTDTAADIYERTSLGVTTLVSIGSANLAATFQANSPDGSIVIFSTDESLVGSDGDTREDVYKAAIAP